MLFDEKVTTNEEFAEPQLRDPDELGRALVFDWDENHFVMEDGSPVMVTKTEAAKEWLNLVVRTRQGRYPIYAPDFGGDAMDIIGKKIPKGYTISEFKRKMTESIQYNPGIDDVEGFTYDGEYIRFTCLLADGTKEVTEVEYRY